MKHENAIALDAGARGPKGFTQPGVTPIQFDADWPADIAAAIEADGGATVVFNNAGTA